MGDQAVEYWLIEECDGIHIGDRREGVGRPAREGLEIERRGETLEPMGARQEQSETAEVGRDLLDELRPAIETAFHVARSCHRDKKSTVDVPAPIRPFLSFARLPPRALDIVREAVDADEAFRVHAASLTEEHDVGPLGWAWLKRPEGWLETVMAAESDVVTRRRNAAAEDRARALELQVERLQLEQQQLQESLAEVEADRDRLGRALETARHDLAEIEAGHARAASERDSLRERVTQLDRRATRAESGLGEERAKVKQLQADLDRAIEQARGATEAAMAGSLVLDDHDTTGMAMVSVDDQDKTSDAAPPVEPVDPNAGSNALGAADAIAAAAELTSSLASALQRAAEHLRPDRPQTRAEPSNDHRVVDAIAIERSAPPRPKRHPLRMARGVPDDSVDGVADLVAVPGIRVIVDGYNVAKTGWPDLELVLQRERLVSGIASKLVATDMVIDVVFDGADVVAGPTTSSPNVRVTWSPADTIADDIIIEMVDAIDPSTPVLVVSSDHDVQYRAGRLGANIAGSPAFFLWMR